MQINLLTNKKNLKKPQQFPLQQGEYKHSWKWVDCHSSLCCETEQTSALCQHHQNTGLSRANGLATSLPIIPVCYFVWLRISAAKKTFFVTRWWTTNGEKGRERKMYLTPSERNMFREKVCFQSRHYCSCICPCTCSLILNNCLSESQAEWCSCSKRTPHGAGICGLREKKLFADCWLPLKRESCIYCLALDFEV